MHWNNDGTWISWLLVSMVTALDSCQYPSVLFKNAAHAFTGELSKLDLLQL
jgi:hypothetical protein